MLNCVYLLCLCGRADWHSLAAPGEHNDSALLGLVVYVFIDMFISQHTGLYPIVSKGMRLIAQGKDPLKGPETHVWHGKHVPLPLHRFPRAG